MKAFRWALAGAGGLMVAGLLAVAALGSGLTQAQTPERGDGYNQALADRLGISVEELTAAREGALDDVLDAAVAEGRLTQEQADRIRENPREARRHFVRGAIQGVRSTIGDLLGVAADTLGISKDEVTEGLKNGQSLAQIAEANGSSADALKAAFTTEIETKLAAAVAEGKLTQEQADRIEQAAIGKLDQLINRTGGERPDFGRLGERLRR